MADLDLFLEKMMPEPNSGCWLWIGAVNPKCARQRASKTYQPTTSRRRRRHLTPSDVVAVREMLAGGIPHSQIAAQMNISISTVSNVRRGKNNYD